MPQARAPMGIEKRAHIAAVGRIEEVQGAWLKVHGRSMSEEDINKRYQNFIPHLLNILEKSSPLRDDVVETVAWLRKQGLTIGSSTGFLTEASNIAKRSATAEGYSPDYSIYATEVSEGRPAPWMIYRVMEN